MVETTAVGSTNSYELLAKLATGGMAEIFLARSSTAGVQRYVVLKRVLQTRVDSAGFIEMFLDEVRVSAQLQHANIAQLHDIGTSGESLFFTMEYVHGVTLAELAKGTTDKGIAIPTACVLTTMAGAAAGLHYAHEKLGLDGKPLRIVHRDVSPSNLMITYEGTVKVVDFGIAKASRRLSDTKDGQVKGKVSYMSPEQVRGLELDRRSDLFSLGIVMWELLSGARLFKRDGEYETMQAIVHEAPPPPSAVRPELPPRLDAIVMRMLAKAREDRFQTAEELLEALEGDAMRSGAMLSPTALGRFVREQCGRRPEPWLERPASAANEVLTIATRLGIPRVAEGSTIIETAPSRGTPRASTAAIPPTASFSYGALAAPKVDAQQSARSRRWKWLAGLAAICVAAVAVWFGVLRPAPQLPAPAAVAPPPVVATEPPAPTPPAPTPIVPVPVPVPVTAPAQIATLAAAHRYADVVAACRTTDFAASDAPRCVTAACMVHDTASARTWLARVEPHRRAAVMQACRPPARSSSKHTHSKPDCNVDPLACQF